MSTANQHYEYRLLLRKARSVELQAGQSSPTLAAQLRALATLYRAEAEALSWTAAPLAPANPAEGMRCI